MKTGKGTLLLLTTIPFHIQGNLVNICTYTSNAFAKYVVLIYIKLMFLVFASVRGVDFSKCREWKCFMEGVITPFEKALLCISERRYYAGFFRKALWRLLERCYNSFLIFKRRNDAFFLLRIIMPFSRYYDFKKGVITPFNFFLYAIQN